MANQCCGLPVIFCSFISHLTGQETINIPEIFSGVRGFTGNTVNLVLKSRRNYHPEKKYIVGVQKRDQVGIKNRVCLGVQKGDKIGNQTGATKRSR